MGQVKTKKDASTKNEKEFKKGTKNNDIVFIKNKLSSFLDRHDDVLLMESENNKYVRLLSNHFGHCKLYDLCILFKRTKYTFYIQFDDDLDIYKANIYNIWGYEK